MKERPPRFTDMDQIEKRFEDGMEQIFRLRAESMATTRELMKRLGSDLGQGVQQALRSSRELAQRFREETQARTEAFRDYIESDTFERDLDRLADRLGVALEGTQPEDRATRVRAKAARLFQHSRKEIFQSAEKASIFAFVAPIRRRPRVLVAITILSGGIRGAGILYECYQVFLPAFRRRKIHAV